MREEADRTARRTRVTAGDRLRAEAVPPPPRGSARSVRPARPPAGPTAVRRAFARALAIRRAFPDNRPLDRQLLKESAKSSQSAQPARRLLSPDSGASRLDSDRATDAPGPPTPGGRGRSAAAGSDRGKIVPHETARSQPPPPRRPHHPRPRRPAPPPRHAPGRTARGPARRSSPRSAIGLRTFYRELELLKRCGVKVQHKDKAYTLLATAEQAEGRLPFPDPQLSFAEMAELSRHPGDAAKRLAELLESVVNHRRPPPKAGVAGRAPRCKKGGKT